MASSETPSTGERPPRRTAIKILGLVAAFVAGFFLIRLLPIWLGLPLLLVIVLGARLFKVKTDRR